MTESRCLEATARSAADGTNRSRNVSNPCETVRAIPVYGASSVGGIRPSCAPAASSPRSSQRSALSPGARGSPRGAGRASPADASTTSTWGLRRTTRDVDGEGTGGVTTADLEVALPSVGSLTSPFRTFVASVVGQARNHAGWRSPGAIPWSPHGSPAPEPQLRSRRPSAIGEAREVAGEHGSIEWHQGGCEAQAITTRGGLGRPSARGTTSEAMSSGLARLCAAPGRGAGAYHAATSSRAASRFAGPFGGRDVRCCESSCASRQGHGGATQHARPSRRSALSRRVRDPCPRRLKGG